MILHPHQAEGIEFLLGRRCAILGHDPGMGKGLTALSAFHEASRAFPGGRSLIIVAPASVITSTWKKEITQNRSGSRKPERFCFAITKR